VGSRRDCTLILGLPGFRVERVEGEGGDATSRVQIRLKRRGRAAIRPVAVAGAPAACGRCVTAPGMTCRGGRSR
jgi:hypothetical protein